ncbi:alcohol dehydrogenase [Striga asiatica]|uniref:Alcohol dehydrogenase n=1 Tax=Striga asiatica TaxID=4170 RepID=A0A5A7PC12_STRAF|nr:alcohol dehydrogenase [Striga asiatica]
MAQTTPNHTQTVSGWAAHDESGHVTPYTFKRRGPLFSGHRVNYSVNRENGINDVTIKILYCGICHTDIHHVKNDWGITIYPVVPGHEIVGIITKVGSNVTNFKVGDRAGVGCLAASCLNCEYCKDGQENYCDKVQFVYNGIFWDGSITYGGYSEFLVADHRYVVHVPESLPMDAAAPLLCAGITVYTPLKDNGLIESTRKKIGIVGLGGLGHIAVKFAKAFGHHVTIISTSPSKEKEAKQRLGADDFILSTNPEQMQSKRRTLDFILDTVSAKHSLGPTLELLKVSGTLVIVGAPDKPMDLPSFPLIFGKPHSVHWKRVVKGSIIGSIKETQDMMDLCGKHNITCDIELVKTDYINEALDRLVKNDVKYRRETCPSTFSFSVKYTVIHSMSKISKMLWSKLRLSSRRKGYPSEDVKSQKGNPNVSEEYNEAFRTKSYTELCNKVEDQLETRTSHKHHHNENLSEYLLDPPQETLTSILKATRNHHEFLINYLNKSQEASRVCELVLQNAHQAISTNHHPINNITNLIEQTPDPKRWTHHHYNILHKNLASFARRKNPFQSTPDKFLELHESYTLLLRQLTSKYKRKKRRRTLIKAASCVGSTALAVSLLVLATNGVGCVVAATGLLACCLGLLAMKRRKLRKGKARRQLDVAARGVYTLMNDLDTLCRLVGVLHDEVERRKVMVGTCVEKGRDEMVKEVVRELQADEAWFMEEVEELKRHVCLCFLNINRARRLLVQEIV